MSPPTIKLFALLLLLGGARGLGVSEELWRGTRATALNLLNHPLIVQLHAGSLPAGSFARLNRDRAALLDGLSAACFAAAFAARARGGSAQLDELRAAVAEEAATAAANSDAWAVAAAAAGKRIGLSEADAAAGAACYACGGAHYEVDCPDERAPSQAVGALAACLRGARGEAQALAGAAAVLRLWGWAHATARAAGLDEGFGEGVGEGAHPFEGWIASFSERWAAAADTAEAALDDAAAAEGVRASELADAYTTAASLLYGLVDSEASVAGLVDDDGGAALAAARAKLGALEPGFLEQHDRHAQFAREASAASAVNGARGQATVPDSPAAAAKRKVDAAAAYLEAKKRAAAVK